MGAEACDVLRRMQFRVGRGRGAAVDFAMGYGWGVFFSVCVCFFFFLPTHKACCVYEITLPHLSLVVMRQGRWSEATEAIFGV